MTVTNWWINSNGKNALKGVEGDPTNPILCSDGDIVYFLQEYADAYLGFFMIVPTMLPEEQARLNNLVLENPIVNTPQENPSDVDERIQRAWNTRGIRCFGPRGGGL